MKIISKETSKRISDHMNNAHIDSVHKYLIHYGKISRFENAYMEEINNSYKNQLRWSVSNYQF